MLSLFFGFHSLILQQTGLPETYPEKSRLRTSGESENQPVSSTPMFQPQAG